MSSLAITVGPPNGRSPKRVVKLILGDKTHTDTCDPLDGFQRQKLLDRAAPVLGVKRVQLASVDAAIAKIAEAPQQQEPWDDVEPFDSFDLPEFPIEALPDPLFSWAASEAEATQTPVDMPAMLSLAMVAAACAKRIECSVKPGWIEPVNLYVVVVLPPGNRKSAVYADATRPIQEYERELIDQMRSEVDAYRNRVAVMEARVKHLHGKAAKADDPEERRKIEDEAKGMADELALLVPTETPRMIVDDCTSEKLQIVLRQQGGRIAVMSPEGGIFDLMKGQYNKAGMPSFTSFLLGHSGDDIRVDRVSRNAPFVQRPAITQALTVQPDVISGLFDVSTFRGRGLLARYLYSIPKSTMGTREVDPPPVPQSVTDEYRAAIAGLCRLPQGQDEHGHPAPQYLTLTPDALEVLHQAMRDIESKLGAGGEFEHFQDWAAKLAGAEVRIASLIHMIVNVTHWQPWSLPIEPDTMQSAVKIGDYLAEHASAAHAMMGTDAEVNEAETVWKWVERQGVNEFTKRDVHRGLRRQFAKPDDLDEPLAEIARRNMIRPKQVPEKSGAGRPASPAFEVNPLALTPTANSGQPNRH